MDDKFPSILWFLKLGGATVAAILLMCCLGAWLVYVARRNEELDEDEGDVDLDQSLGSYKVQESTQSTSWGHRQNLLEMNQSLSHGDRRRRDDFILSPIVLGSQLGGGRNRSDSDSDFEMVDLEEAKVTTAMLSR